MPPTRRIRLIALDLDGTLLDGERRVSARNRAALREAGARGVVVALASGRMTACIAPFAEALGLDCPIIAYNGGMARGPARDGSQVLFHRPLPARHGRALVDFCRGRYMLNFYLDDRLYAQDLPALRRFAEVYSGRTKARYEFVEDLAPFARRAPTKLVIVTDRPERERLHAEWVARLGSGAGIVKTDPEYLEFLNRRADKGVALRALAKALGVGMRECLAMGDGDNDAPMLRAAGLGIAVANATELAMASAREVSPLAHDRDAVADAVDRHVLSGGTADVSPAVNAWNS